MTALDVRADRLTSTQRSAIMMHFGRIGLAHPTWRDARLDVTAALLGLDRVGSVNELDRGQAGQLVAALGRLRDTRDLAVVLAHLITGDSPPDPRKEP